MRGTSIPAAEAATPRRARADAGLTLVEVVIAVLILAIGMLGAAALQGSGLNATRTSQEIQELNAEARSELDARRLQLTTTTFSNHTTGACLVTGDFACTVEIRPCRVIGASLDCSAAVAPVPAPAAHAVTVTISTGQNDVTLQTVVLGELP